MSEAFIVGLFCGLGLVALIGFLIGFFAQKARKEKGIPPAEYDERQELIRHRGYRLAYKSLIIYLLAYTVLDAFGVKWCYTWSGMFLGILFSLMVFVIYCIYKDAYFRVSDRPGFYAALFAALGAVNLVCGLVIPDMKGMERDPLLGLEDVNFVVGGFILIIFVNVLIKLHLDRRSDER